MFSSSKKLVQQTAESLISGHYTLVVWWGLKHAGVFEAMLKMEQQEGGLDPLVHATRTNMAPEVLAAMLDYLGATGLVTIKDKRVTLSAEGKALLEKEDGVLELMRSYEPVVANLEHLLAKLKAHGPAVAGLRRADAVTASQSSRFAGEVYPAIAEVIEKGKFSHVMDVTCGAGDLLVHLAKHIRNMVGVGIGGDGILVRQANKTINAAGLDKRLIAVTANPIEVCTETKRVFDRIGISPQLWEEIDCVVAAGICSEVLARDGAETGVKNGDAVVKVLAALPRNFRKAHVVLVEPTASPRFEKNYYASELTLLMRLCKTTPWPVEQWRETIGKAKLRVVQEMPLTTDGLTVFLCRAR